MEIMSIILIGNMVFTLINVSCSVFVFCLKQKIKVKYAKQLEYTRIEYSSLYKKRAEAIEEIYYKLYEIKKYIDDIQIASSQEEYEYNVGNFDIKKLDTLVRDLEQFYGSKRIYLNKGTFEKLEKFASSIFVSISNYEYEVERGALLNPQEEFCMNLPNGAWKSLLETIVNDFQKLIGINNDN